MEADATHLKIVGDRTKDDLTLEERIEILSDEMDKLLFDEERRIMRKKVLRNLSLGRTPQKYRPMNTDMVFNAIVAGNQTYDLIQTATKLTDNQIGLALSELIPHRVKTRHEGDTRKYFPATDKLRFKTTLGRDPKRRAA